MAGSEEQVATDPSPRKFVVDVSERDQNDLKLRLRLARYPDQINGAGWEYGTELEYLKELMTYWKDQFSWPQQQAWMNSHFNHFKLQLGGLDVHFVHHPSKKPGATPLLLVHGWPGSFLEFQKIIPMLEQGGNYHLVALSLPGFGFSSAPQDAGFGVPQHAATCNQLMLALGYPKYVAQGGDWGGDIVFTLGCHHSANCKAIHTNFPIAVPKLRQLGHLSQYINSKLPILNQIPLTMTQRELEGMKRNEWFLDKHRGYYSIQMTQPQTLGYGLQDSPTGLAAWLVEKFRSYSDCNGNVETRFSKHELLTMFSLYWFTGTIASSMRIYKESNMLEFRQRNLAENHCGVPSAVAIFPKELFQAPKAWLQQQYNLKSYSTFDSGGHFAALEEPSALVRDMCQFYSSLTLQA
ncbi:hypothetical protein WJX74_007113 [Apatococcus lobatus]|uniref:Epoxide hydrolase N-terminal domain-containing protein n=1 Tax=Apatococcus lobatus TaxID=904363 RepID=A0AAW1QCJ3_9CHLO